MAGHLFLKKLLEGGQCEVYKLLIRHEINPLPYMGLDPSKAEPEPYESTTSHYFLEREVADAEAERISQTGGVVGQLLGVEVQPVQMSMQEMPKDLVEILHFEAQREERRAKASRLATKRRYDLPPGGVPYPQCL